MPGTLWDLRAAEEVGDDNLTPLGELVENVGRAFRRNLGCGDDAASRIDDGIRGARNERRLRIPPNEMWTCCTEP